MRTTPRCSSATPRAGRSAYTAQWNDDFHHALYVLLTGESRGHYGDYAEPGAQLLRTLLEGFAYQGEPSAHRGAARGSRSAELPAEAFVNFLQNHDQIGNRPDAARLWQLLEPRRQARRGNAAALLPTPILLFMGDEFHAPSGFPFFCDFAGDLGRAVTEGRRNEFASLWRDVDCDPVPSRRREAARAAAVLDWAATRTRTAPRRARANAAATWRSVAESCPRACPRAPRPENCSARARSSSSWTLGRRHHPSASSESRCYAVFRAARDAGTAPVDDRGRGQRRMAAVVRRVDARALARPRLRALSAPSSRGAVLAHELELALFHAPADLSQDPCRSPAPC